MTVQESHEITPSGQSEAAAPQQVPAISIQSVDKTFRRRGGSSVKPVNGVTLDVHHGELVVLLGPSGCGKTTLLRCVAGLERPDAGTIRINDRVVYSEADRVFLPPNKRRLSMIFQSYALWPHMSVSKNVAYPLQCAPQKIGRAEIRERVERVLQTTGLGGLGEQFPGQLSGGQQQRVALARALVANPDVVLFDEPLSNVDAQVREQLRVELLSMQRELGFAALYVTHDQAEAMELGHRIAVLRDGVLEQVASPREVYRRPANLYVASFIGTTNVLSATARSVDGGSVEVTSAAGTVEVDQEAVDERTKARLDDHNTTGCLAVFRPESIELKPIDPADASRHEGAWIGAIETAMFIGSHVEYLIEVGGERVRVWTSQDQHLDEGTTVTFTLDPTRVLVMAAEAES